MPFWIVLPLVGRVAITVGQMIAGAAVVGTAATGVAAVAAHNDGRSRRNLREAQQIAQDVLEMATLRVAEINREYRQFFWSSRERYDKIYKLLDIELKKIGSCIPVDVVSPKNLRFADEVTISEFGELYWGDVSWGDLKSITNNAAKATLILTRSQGQISIGNSAAAFGILTAISVGAQALGSLLENSEVRLTESEDELSWSQTYKGQVESGIELFLKGSRADIATRKAALAALSNELDDMGDYQGANTQGVAIDILHKIRALIERPLYQAAPEI